MEREAENDERIEEVDWESRTKSGDRAGSPGKGGTSGDTGDSGDSGDSGGGARPSETQGDERQRMGNKDPDSGRKS
jgi:hypothetical protein